MRRFQWLGLLGLAGLLWLGGCDATPAEGQFRCASNRDCPRGWLCDLAADGYCYSAEAYADMHSTDSLMDNDSDSGSAPTDTMDTQTADTGTASETSADTGSDSDTGGVNDSDTGTVDDSDTPADSESNGDTGTTDTGTDDDSESDSASDSDSDTQPWDSDTGTGSDDSDSQDTETADSDSDTGVIANDCAHPVEIKNLSASWSGQWSAFGDTFGIDDPPNCGTGEAAAWFAITLAAGASVQIKETSDSNVLLRHVEGCSAASCIKFTDQPERLTIDNNTSDAGVFYLVVSKAAGNTADAFTVTFTL